MGKSATNTMKMSRISDEEISSVFKQLLKKPILINEDDTALIFHDLSYLKHRINELVSFFPGNTLHAIAIKANPLFKVLQEIKNLGIGFEAASLPELYFAEKSGVSPDKIIFDSPAKTITEIAYALNMGCHINADSLYELDRIAELIGDRKHKSTVGIRINPQVGTGNITYTSVAGEYSKFGVALKENREVLKAKFEQYEWLTGVHLHIGSQGCSVEMLLEGVKTILDFTHEVNDILPKKHGKHQINIFDLGGGLPVSYHRDKPAVLLSDYVKALKGQFNELFTDDFKLITEFGRYIHANAGWVASKVEYVKRDTNINTAMIHVGADLFLRKCYRPDDWHHEILVLDHFGNLKTGTDKNKYMIAGPLCFAGDVIATEIQLPLIEQGDYIIIQDTGAYTLSMWSRYNSRQIPKVIGYFNEGKIFEILRERESLDALLAFWS